MYLKKTKVKHTVGKNYDFDVNHPKSKPQKGNKNSVKDADKVLNLPKGSIKL